MQIHINIFDNLTCDQQMDTTEIKSFALSYVECQ